MIMIKQKCLVFIIIGALVITACNYGINQGKKTDYITLSTIGAGGRALTGLLAEAGSDFFEASFKKTSDDAVFRTTWSFARNGSIQLAPGDYEVIIFAGRENTLLGVGKVLLIDGVVNSASDLVIEVTTETAEIVFELQPLVNNITGDSISIPSTIQVIDPPALPDPPPIQDSLGNDIPVFMISDNLSSPSTLEWNFGVYDLGSESTLEDYNESIIVKTAATVFIGGVPGKEHLYVSGVTVTPAAPLSGAIPSDGAITFTAVADNSVGMVRMLFELPVCAFEDTYDAFAWYIRGGLNNAFLDAGPVPSSQPNSAGMLGGAIVLGFGTF